MGRSPCCFEEGEKLNRGAWTAREDKLLTSYIETHGECKWSTLPKRAGLNRSGKSCRLRWLNYLRPDIKRGNITHDEEELIVRLHKLLGNRWSLIAGRLPGRTDNEIKNYWNTTLAKKLRTQSCSAMSEQHPTMSKSTASEPDVINPPQIIRTKASRCRNVVIPDPPCPKKNLLTSTQIEFDEAHLTTQFTNQSRGSYTSKAQLVYEHHQFLENHYSDVNRDEFQDQLNAADFCTYLNLDSNMQGDMDLHIDQSTPIDGLMVNRWSTNGSKDNNATLDLDFTALLLDSGDWP